MISLTLPTIDSQLNTLELELAQLQEETKLLDTKYQLEIQGIAKADAIHLAKFNFLKEIDAEDHKELLAHWSDRKIVLPPAYQPTPKPTPLSEISVGDRVHKGWF